MSTSKSNLLADIVVPRSIGRYTFGENVGDGSFSVVKIVKNKDNRSFYACKIVPKAIIDTNAKRDAFEREIRINQQVHHPGHVELLDLFVDDNNYYIIMQFCPNGSLLKYIVDNVGVSEEVAKPLFRQIIETMKYLQDFRISHRDLKPENLLFTEEGKLQIADFGLATYVDENNLVKTPCGTITYASPECLSGKPYNGFTTDVWSCGIVLYEMLTAHSPWKKSSQKETCELIKNGKFEVPDELTSSCKDLILKMLTVSPNDRITVSEILKHKWLEGVPVQFNPKEETIYTAVSLKMVDRFFQREVTASSIRRCKPHRKAISRNALTFKKAKKELSNKLYNIIKSTPTIQQQQQQQQQQLNGSNAAILLVPLNGSSSKIPSKKDIMVPQQPSSIGNNAQPRYKVQPPSYGKGQNRPPGRVRGKMFIRGSMALLPMDEETLAAAAAVAASNAAAAGNAGVVAGPASSRPQPPQQPSQATSIRFRKMSNRTLHTARYQ